jgi:hypothetical protein
MAEMTAEQVAAVAQKAGFVGEGLIMAVAIAWAESGLNPAAEAFNKNSGGNVTSTDRGLWQINDYWYPEVDNACAYIRDKRSICPDILWPAQRRTAAVRGGARTKSAVAAPGHHA